MKKKITIIIASIMIVIGTVLIVNSNYVKVKADPGFDSSWGSGGGSSSSSSSDSSSRSGSSSTSGTSRETTKADLAVITVGVLAIAIVFTFTFVAAAKSEREREEEIKYVLPAEEVHRLLGEKFDIEKFNKDVFDRYYKVCIAWSNNDADSLKGLVSDEMYNMYRTQILTMVNKHERNVMSEIKCVDSHISSIKVNENSVEIKSILRVTCKDYMIDEKTKEVTRGYDEFINDYTYEITSVCDVVKTKKITKCPKCGGKLGDDTSTTCPYCRSIIVKPSNKYVMTQKEMLKQDWE